MAQKVVTTLVDDLDGTPATGAVRFGLDGKVYEIDLNDKNQEKLTKALRPFISSARQVKATRNSRKRTVTQ